MNTVRGRKKPVPRKAEPAKGQVSSCGCPVNLAEIGQTLKYAFIALHAASGHNENHGNRCLYAQQRHIGYAVNHRGQCRHHNQPPDHAVGNTELRFVEYVDDFSGVSENVYRLLSDGGIFLFSQEHPFSTCYSGKEDRWTRDENGRKIHANIADYCVERRNDSTWFVEGFQRYHRMFSTIINTLSDTGFRILKIAEPYPTEELVRKYPEYYDLYHKPDFLFVKSVK